MTVQEAYRFARMLCRTYGGHARDLVQDVMEAYVRALGSYDGRSDEGVYLRTKMRYALRDALNRRRLVGRPRGARSAGGRAKRIERSGLVLHTDAVPAGEVPYVLAACDAPLPGAYLDLDVVLGRLRPLQRDTLTRRFLLDESPAEIAAADGVGEGAVWMRVNAALKACRGAAGESRRAA